MDCVGRVSQSVSLYCFRFRFSGCDQFTIATKSDGTVWAWGDNQVGQYGNGTVGNPVYVPTLMTGLCATLNATEFEQDNVFTMYPNPAKDVVSLAYNLTDANATVEVCDVTGRLIHNVALNSFSGTNELNVSAYPAGVYLVLYVILTLFPVCLTTLPSAEYIPLNKDTVVFLSFK